MSAEYMIELLWAALDEAYDRKEYAYFLQLEKGVKYVKTYCNPTAGELGELRDFEDHAWYSLKDNSGILSWKE